MSTYSERINAVKADIDALITYANETTGKEDTHMGDAVQSLIDGYGGGGSTSGWTGHADTEGLKAIGWTDTDIANYQAKGVYWDEEDDDLHKVSDDNKALYGVLTPSNCANYYDRMKCVYLPKIDFSSTTSFDHTFSDWRRLEAIPSLDFSKVTMFHYVFNQCYSLNYIGGFTKPLDATFGACAFESCYSLRAIPDGVNLYASNSGCLTFEDCRSLTRVKNGIVGNNISIMFNRCYAIREITLKVKDGYEITNTNYCFNEGANTLTHFEIDGSLAASLNMSATASPYMDYTSIKSLLTAAGLSSNTDSKTLTFASGTTISDNNGELAALVSAAEDKGWTISNLTIS